jgi:hypothetical protein
MTPDLFAYSPHWQRSSDMTVHHSVTIKRPSGGGGSYTFEFGGSPARMNKHGHIWLNQDPPTPIDIQLEIKSANFVFQNPAASAFFTSNTPGPKTAFKGLGVFSGLTLDSTLKNLTFTIDNSVPGVFYYQLNVFDQTRGVNVTWDPIIINQP